MACEDGSCRISRSVRFRQSSNNASLCGLMRGEQLSAVADEYGAIVRMQAILYTLDLFRPPLVQPPPPPASPSSKIKDKSFPKTGTPGMLRPWLPRAVMPALDAVIHAAGSPREREVLYNVAAWMAGARPATPIKGDDADPNSGRRFQKNRFPNFLRLNVLIFHDMAGNSFGKIWRREIRLLRNPLI